MASPDDNLTEEIVAAVLAIFGDGRLESELVEAIGRIAAVIVEEEVRQASALLSLNWAIDPVAIALEWAKDIPERARGINATTVARLRALLRAALADQLTIRQTAGIIEQMFDTIDEGRAVVIARTEVLGASNFAAWRTFLIGSVPFKRWVSTMDDRVRDTHRDAHGQVRGVSEAFDVGGYAMMYPGDPDGPAKEVVNCRCHIVPETTARSIWTAERIHAIWMRYVSRAIQYDGLMIPAIQQEFKSQQFLIATVFNRYSQ
jgi:hypothetical protein